MAHQVLTDIPEAKKEKVRIVERVSTVFRTKLPVVLDTLLVLTIAFWYFFFTGLAICLGRQLPKAWMEIGTGIAKGKVAKKVEELKQAQVESEKPKPTHRVIDIESKRELNPIGV